MDASERPKAGGFDTIGTVSGWPVKIRCFYSCAACGLDGVGVEVESRGPENVVEWMENVLGPVVSDDHFNRSPACKAKKLTQVKIPLTGRAKVGGPVKN